MKYFAVTVWSIVRKILVSALELQRQHFLFARHVQRRHWQSAMRSQQFV
jgi:hypothetical protein